MFYKPRRVGRACRASWRLSARDAVLAATTLLILVVGSGAARAVEEFKDAGAIEASSSAKPDKLDTGDRAVTVSDYPSNDDNLRLSRIGAAKTASVARTYSLTVSNTNRSDEHLQPIYSVGNSNPDGGNVIAISPESLINSAYVWVAGSVLVVFFFIMMGGVARVSRSEGDFSNRRRGAEADLGAAPPAESIAPNPPSSPVSPSTSPAQVVTMNDVMSISRARGILARPLVSPLERPSSHAASALVPTAPRRRDPEGSRLTSFGGSAKPRPNRNNS